MVPFNIHTTRHTYASHLVQRGVPLATVAKLLGQSVLTVTGRYAHLGRSDLHDGVRVLEARSPFRPLPLLSSTSEEHARSAANHDFEIPEGFLGRPTGVEPVTPGATVRCSAS